MDLKLLRLFLDLMFYLSISFPIMIQGSVILKVLLILPISIWLIWIGTKWETYRLASCITSHVALEFKLLIIIQLIEAVIIGFENWTKYSVPFIILFIIDCIILLRLHRITEGNQNRHLLLKYSWLHLTILIIAAAILSSKWITGSVTGFLALVYSKLILPILILIIRLFEKILWFLRPMLKALLNQTGLGENQVQLSDASAQEILKMDIDSAGHIPLFISVGGIILVAFAIIFTINFIRKKFKVVGEKDPRKVSSTIVNTAIPAVSTAQTHRNNPFTKKDVRYIYRKFLTHCLHNGIPIQGCTTSTLTTMASDKWKDKKVSIERLREIYLSARYGCNESKESIKEAKSLYKTIKTIDK